MPEPDSNGSVCPRCGAKRAGTGNSGLCSLCLLNAFFSPPGSNPAPETSPIDTSPPAFGNYDDLELIARGGMGVVYRARHRTLNRVIALKLVALTHLNQPQTRQRFRLEAEAAAKLDHPNITPVYEIGEENGQPFLAMKYGEGGSLADLLQQNRSRPLLDPKRVARIVAKIARAVHHAHERGVLHRDLKPANILMDSGEEPMVSDFGLARFLDQDASLTVTGSVLGTPAYMSPEQTGANSENVTIATDIWGIGVILYELLSGAPPFLAESTAQLIRRIAEDPPARLTGIPGVDRDLETICFKCLAKEPAQRYASALSVAEDLERWDRNEPILARPTTWAEKSAKWIRRNPVFAGLILVSTLSFVAFVSAIVVSRTRLREANERIQAQSEQRRQQTVRLNVAAGNRRADDLDMGNALLWLAEGLRLDQDGGAKETAHRIRFESLLERMPTLQQLWFLPGAVNVTAFFADGASVALGCSDGKVYFRHCDSGVETRPPITTAASVSRVILPTQEDLLITQHSGLRWACYSLTSGKKISPPELERSTLLSFGRKANLLAMAGSNSVSIIKISDWKPICPELPLGARPTRALFFENDTRMLTTADGILYSCWDLQSGNRLHDLRFPQKPLGLRPAPLGGHVIALMPNDHLTCWRLSDAKMLWESPDTTLANPEFIFTAAGDKVMSWGAVGNARVLEVSTGHALTLPFPAHNGVVSMSFSPDEQYLCTSGFDGNTVIWDAKHARHASPPIPHGLFVLSTIFAPDGESFLTACADGTARLWRWRPPSRIGMKLSHPSGITSGQWSADGQRLMTWGDKMVQVWNASTGIPLSSPLVHPSEVLCATFSPDGEELISGSSDGMLRTWNVHQAQETSPGLQLPQPIRNVRVSRSGKEILTILRGNSARLLTRSPQPESTGWALGPSLDHTRPIVDGEFDPSGQWILTAADDGLVKVWSSQTGQLKFPPLKHVGRVSEAHFSADGTKIASGSWDSTIQARGAMVWDVATGKAIAGPLLLRDGVLSVALSPKADQLVATGEDTFGYLWDVPTGQRRGMALQHLSDIRKVIYSPNGILIATASSDTSARVWEASTGEAITPPLWHHQRVNWVGFNPASTRLATSSADGTAMIYDLHPNRMPFEDLLQMAELISAHELTEDGSRRPVSREGLQRRWQSLKSKYPDRFAREFYSTRIR